mmetsp:Transcript_11150/g.22501  ORF Transcript_11150/g.22501 Transcript_11150/m.22501 type:complete len:225 (-) Transcript_11150:368-1042(-)
MFYLTADDAYARRATIKRRDEPPRASGEAYSRKVHRASHGAVTLRLSAFALTCLVAALLASAAANVRRRGLILLFIFTLLVILLALGERCLLEQVGERPSTCAARAIERAHRLPFKLCVGADAAPAAIDAEPVPRIWLAAVACLLGKSTEQLLRKRGLSLRRSDRGAGTKGTRLFLRSGDLGIVDAPPVLVLLEDTPICLLLRQAAAHELLLSFDEHVSGVLNH